jgi:uncharacterized protein (DUF1684 family)
MELRLNNLNKKMRVKIYSALFFLICMMIVFLSMAQQSNKEYKKEIERWDAERLESVKSPTGWVNLAGLFWLKNGKNNFGSASTNELVFPNNGFPSLLGTFELQDEKVKWITASGNEVWYKKSKVDEMEVFNIDSMTSPTLSYSTYRWNIIKREDKIGVRFRDLNNPALAALTHINRFDANPKWKINAYLEPSSFSTVAITNVLGQTYQQASPGKIVFEVEDKTYKLDAVEEGPKLLQVIFDDETNGIESYPSGRFLYVTRPGADGKVVIDFNKAFNPPCAFSPFATCPLPPKQNILPIRIEAGEKTIHH